MLYNLLWSRSPKIFIALQSVPLPHLPQRRRGDDRAVHFIPVGPAGHLLAQVETGEGQPIRDDGPKAHLLTKKGTPTMGGVLILLALAIARPCCGPTSPTAIVWAVLFVTTSASVCNRVLSTTT